MSGVGKTTAARAIARRYDLWFHPIDLRTYAHAERMNVPALAMTADELWIDRTPEQMADDFETEARDRFPLVLEDVQTVPDDGAPVLVEGPQLLPDLVGPHVLFVAASPILRRALVSARGSLTYARTRDTGAGARESAPPRRAARRATSLARRRDENERWFDQWRRYAGYEPRARDSTLEFACECNRPGCAEVVSVTLDDASNRPLLAH